MKCEFVGHPLTEIPLEPLTLSLVPDGKEGILLLPGSRSAEIKNLLPIFIQSASLLFQKNKNLFFLIPTFQKFESYVRLSLKDVAFPYLLIPQEQKWQAFQQAKAALAASGTVSLELAKASVPMVISYKLNYLTYLLAKAVIKTPWVCLINILLQKAVIKERLQSECKAEILANDIERLLTPSENEKIKEDIRKAYNLLKPDLEKPSEKAASLIYDMI
jgi:lipid-A-disaccharide synthase